MSTAAPVPAGLWQLRPLRAALAQDDIGAVLVETRRSLGVSQAQLAHLLSDDELSFSQAKVSRIEAGTPVRDIDDRRRISDVLGIPPELLGLASVPALRRASLALRPVVSPVPRVEEVSDPMRRRTVLTGAAALMGWSLTGALDVPQGAPVGPAHVEQIGSALTHLWALDDRHGGEGLDQLAVALFERAQGLLAGATYSTATGQRLQVLAGRLAEHAGWLSFDAGRPEQARAMLTEAMTAARVAGDDELEVLVLGTLSVHAGEIGRHREAISFASRAQANPVARHTPVALTMGAFREARAYAQARDRAAAEKAMLRGERAFARANARPEWVGYLDQAELSAKIGYCWAALGRPARAIPFFEAALAGQRPDYRRNRALYTGYLARAHLANRDLEHAATVGTEALALSAQVTSARARRQVGRLGAALKVHTAVPAARAYLDSYEASFGPAPRR